MTCLQLVIETCLTGVEMQMGTKLFMTLCRKESSVAFTDCTSALPSWLPHGEWEAPLSQARDGCGLGEAVEGVSEHSPGMDS